MFLGHWWTLLHKVESVHGTRAASDSTILAELIRMRTQRATRGFSPAALVIASAALRRLMEIVRFQEIFPMYEDLDSALAATNAKSRSH
jgi:hypothetical protein